VSQRKAFRRYAVMGVMAFTIDLGVTLALARVMHYLVANVFGFLVANAAQFVVAHAWVFAGSLRDPGLITTYLKTLSISTAGVAMSTLIVWFGAGILQFDLVIAKVAASFAVLALNYLLRRRFVYR
jgi:putative flippase GtrA